MNNPTEPTQQAGWDAVTNQGATNPPAGFQQATDAATGQLPQAGPATPVQGLPQQVPGISQIEGIPQQQAPGNSQILTSEPYHSGQYPPVGAYVQSQGPEGPNRIALLLAILAVVLLVAIGAYFLFRSDEPQSGGADSGVFTNSTESDESDAEEPDAPATEIENSSTTRSAEETVPSTDGERVTTSGNRATTSSSRGTSSSANPTTETTRRTTTEQSTTVTTGTTTTSEDTTTVTSGTTSSTTTTTSSTTTTSTTIGTITVTFTIPTTTLPISTISIPRP